MVHNEKVTKCVFSQVHQRGTACKAIDVYTVHSDISMIVDCGLVPKYGNLIVAIDVVAEDRSLTMDLVQSMKLLGE
jgi:hypothetical protein